MTKENLISNWIYNLLNNEQLPYELFITENFFEDGMDLISYWKYEKKNFLQLSPLYDLNNDFSIKIISEFQINIDTSLCFFYLYNKFHKIVYKMHQTIIKIQEKYFFLGNQFNCQLVPKFTILNNKLDGYGLAINCNYEIKKIISPLLKLEWLNDGANYINDKFYNAKFSSTDEILTNTWHDFYIYLNYNNKIIIEKQKIYFDNLDFESFPLLIKNNNCSIINELYPVNLTLYQNTEVINYSYPRNISFTYLDYNKIIITDVLDNDWYLYP